MAGWYRYVPFWHFNLNGTIKARYGFAAVNTSNCACNEHYHNIYWRINWCVGRSQQSIQKFDVAENKYKPVTVEEVSTRTEANTQKQKWKIIPASTFPIQASVELVPGQWDLWASYKNQVWYTVADSWILKYNNSRSDMTYTASTPGINYYYYYYYYFINILLLIKFYLYRTLINTLLNDVFFIIVRGRWESQN